MLLGDPSWPNYAQMMQLLKITPVHFPLRPEADLVPQAADVEPLITERTQAILLNSPGNPTRRGHRCRGPGRLDGNCPPARSAGFLR